MSSLCDFQRDFYDQKVILYDISQSIHQKEFNLLSNDLNILILVTNDALKTVIQCRPNKYLLRLGKEMQFDTKY